MPTGKKPVKKKAMIAIHKPIRKRKPVNLTLSDVARSMGRELAEARGIEFTQLVEQLVRRELRAAGKLPPE